MIASLELCYCDNGSASALFLRSISHDRILSLYVDDTYIIMVMLMGLPS